MRVISLNVYIGIFNFFFLDHCEGEVSCLPLENDKIRLNFNFYLVCWFPSFKYKLMEKRRKTISYLQQGNWSSEIRH